MPEKEFKYLLVKVTNEFKEDRNNMEIVQNSLQHLHGGSQTPVSENSLPLQTLSIHVGTHTFMQIFIHTDREK